MAEILRLPKMSDTMEEGVFAEVNIKVGDTIATGDVVAEVETDKATMEMESYQEGTVLHLAVGAGDTIPVNGMVAVLGEPGEDFQALIDAEANAPVAEDDGPAVETAKEDDTDNVVELAVTEPAPIPVSQNGDGRVKASPLAKKIAEEKGINIANVPGSGDEGRIIKKDVEAYSPAASAPAAVHESASAPATEVKLPTIVAEEGYEEIKVSQMRKVIAKRLSESKFGAPHFYLTIEVNMNGAIEARKQMNAVAPVKISYNDMVIKACASALRQHPAVNSSWLGDKIRLNHHIHIGMAVAVDEGLLVPVIKFADNKSLSHISVEAKEFAGKARSKKLMPEEMQGNTFSISNLGMLGISEFTAVINPPDACILAVGGIKKELAFGEDGDLIENNIMKLTLSCDHRVVDGAVGSAFLKTLKENLEQPVRMLV